MNLKEEFEILRGQPIAIVASSGEVPCFETSDAEWLCKHPLVSVHMMAFKHEKYIAKAIESVISQKTYIEFELVIGEDASPDKTRNICFEYQRKYPKQIRVLWSNDNVFAIGGNETRVTAACRGDYIAFCEGDDYWTDSHKLQKQVDVMRSHPNVGLCFCDADIKIESTGEFLPWNCGYVFPKGEMGGLRFALMHIFGSNPLTAENDCSTLMTATVLIRKTLLLEAKQRFEVFSWNLLLSDTTMWLGIAFFSDVYYLPDKVSVYRRNDTGLTSNVIGSVCRDAMLVRVFFVVEGLKLSLSEVSASFCDNIVRTCYAQFMGRTIKNCREYICRVLATRLFSFLFRRKRSFPILFALNHGWVSIRWLVFFGRLYNRMMFSFNIPKKLADLYVVAETN